MLTETARTVIYSGEQKQEPADNSMEKKKPFS